MSRKRSVRACFVAGALLLSVATGSPAGATILHDVDYMAGEVGQNEYNKVFAYNANPGLCQYADSWSNDWKWYCTSDQGSDLTTTGDSIQVPAGSTVTFSKKEVQGKRMYYANGLLYTEPALGDFSRDISRVRWYVADLNEVDTTTIPSASMTYSGGSSGGSGGDFSNWARVRALSWSRKFENLGDSTVKLRVDYTDGTFEEASGNIRVVADSVTAAIAKTISSGGSVDSSAVLTTKTVFLSAGSSTSLGGVLSKFEWDLDGDGTYETDGGTTNTRSTSFTTSGSKTVGVRVTSRGGSTSTATTTIDVLKSPPSGEAGVSIIDGASYTNKKAVQLNLVWPEYATAVRISNDGGFAASKTQTKDLAASIDWELDDSVKGIYTKVVYVRFNGVANTKETYTDDIILDTTAPTITSTDASTGTSTITLSLAATDDITGVDNIQIMAGSTTVTKNYASNVSVPLANLGLVVSTSSINSMSVSTAKSLSVTTIKVRVSDSAGNWTRWRTVSVSGKTLAPKVTPKISASTAVVAWYAGLAVPTGAKILLQVSPSTAAICRVAGTTLKGLKVGSCKVTVTVTPKKGTATSKTVTLKVTK